MSELSDKPWAAGNFAADNSSRGVSPAGPAPEYKTYYGTKRIMAKPAFCRTGRPDDGYAILYPDGYLSWSPKAVFDAAYQPIDALSFGHAIVAMKEGRRVARSGWTGQWLAIEDHESKVQIRTYTTEGPVPYIRGWIASPADILADDWRILEG